MKEEKIEIFVYGIFKLLQIKMNDLKKKYYNIS